MVTLPLSTGAVCLPDEPNRLRHYEGTIGEKYRVRMTLEIAYARIEGVYFYTPQFTDIQLEGEITDGKNVAIDELDAKGEVTARFEGNFLELPPPRKRDDQLECETITGFWTKLDSEKKLPFFLRLESAGSGNLDNRFSRYPPVTAPPEVDQDNFLRF
jgi:hypothetical protein